MPAKPIIALAPPLLTLALAGCGDRGTPQAGHTPGSAQAARAGSHPQNPYTDLRSSALSITPAKIGLTPKPDDVVGLIVDWGQPGGTATVVCFAEGTTSIYFSGGGGIFGAGAHQNVLTASNAALAAASLVAADLPAADSFPLPAPDHARFTVVTGAGNRSKAVPVAELSSASHPLHPLWAAVQDVITQVRRSSGG